ncbi:MAG: hypothetical protein IPN88_04690 [Bacteroidetes bacterium]|nr:hypothetical protein [Bacteroidota bacterium]
MKEVSLIFIKVRRSEPVRNQWLLLFILLDDQQTLTDKQIDKTMERLMVAFGK